MRNDAQGGGDGKQPTEIEGVLERMLRVRILGLALVAMFTLSVAAASSASAALFVGSPVGALVLGHALTNQIFTTEPGKEVVCTGADTDGTIEASRALHQVVNVTYLGCTAFGQKTKITPAEYLFSADGLVAVINKTIEITVEGLGGGCKVKVAPQHFPTGISYKNNGTTMLEEISNVKGIVFTTSGGFCGANGNNGTYTGNSELLVDATGGSVQIE